MKRRPRSRRDFFQMTALSIGALGLGSPAMAESGALKNVALVIDPADTVASAAPVARLCRNSGQRSLYKLLTT